MYRSILVLLDGSMFAEHALPIACSIARRAGAKLQLVLVHIPVTGYVDGRVTLDETRNLPLKTYEQGYLDEVVKRLTMGSDVLVTSTLLEGKAGQVAEILNDHAKAAGADLLVMATYGRGALAGFWLGGVADTLVQQASMPILLVQPQEAAPDLVREQVFQHVLIPLDGSALAEQVLEPAVTLGKLMHADYTLLRVVPLTMPGNPSLHGSTGLEQQLLELLQADAQSYLDNIANRLRAQSLQVQTKVVIHQNPETAILEEANKRAADLIAMETRGHGGLTQLLVGSVTHKVLRDASTPVLLHRLHSKFS